MTSDRPRNRLIGRKVLILAPAVAVFIYAATNVFRVGFLADDYHGGEVVVRHAAEHPDVFDRIVTTFTRRWVIELPFWHRPLLPLLVQLDYALWGADGRMHHLSSVLLWAGIAAAAAALAARITAPHAPLTPAVVGALALVYPAGSEALGWLAARDDLMFAFFGLLALRARLATPASVAAGLPWLVLALLSKESAVVLIPMMNLCPLLAPRPAGTLPVGRTARIWREALPWAVLAAWFALRFHVLEGAGSSYGPYDYWGAAHSQLGGHPVVAFVKRFFIFLGHSLLQLAAPVNEKAAKSLALDDRHFRATFLALSGVLVLLGLLVARQRGDWKRVLLLVCGIVGPVALLSPIFVVRFDMNGGRALVFPGACFVILLGLAFDRAVRRHALTRAAAILVIVALFLLSAFTFLIGLAPFLQATQSAERVIESLRPVPPGDEVVMARTYTGPGTMRGDLVMADGAYVLSSGLHYALAPPFRTGPRSWVTILANDAELLRIPPDKPRPWLVTLPADTRGRPEFRVLAKGRSAGPAAELAPAHGTTLSAAEPLRFRIRLPESAWKGVATLAVTTTDLVGHVAHAELSGAALEAARSPDGTVVVEPSRFTPPLDADELMKAGPLVFVWWAEGRNASGAEVFRSTWQAASFPPRS